MKIVIQRVSSASVFINKSCKASINKGLLILIGIEEIDTIEDIEWLIGKILRLRIFDDANGIMNLSIQEINGDILVISQFTLHASTKKGNRPSYLKAAKPDIAIPIYEKFLHLLEIEFKKTIQSGIFGADMKVELVNDGPVTIIIDSKNRE